ncbi:hypothetical protein QQP08_008238 [Theobroma cacao]|nr:hypothetical protein QQP08_008238 [Theobroma cacao]
MGLQPKKCGLNKILDFALCLFSRRKPAQIPKSSLPSQPVGQQGPNTPASFLSHSRSSISLSLDRVHLLNSFATCLTSTELRRSL